MLASFRVAAASLVFGLATVSAPCLTGQAEGDKPYTVECAAGAENAKDCKVDRNTFVGWRTYHANCHVCHAQDAVGSTFAPSLVERLQAIDHERFLHSVEEGYTGQIGVMPGWKDNPNVNKRFEDLYGYLRARADGALPPGRPERLPN
jgi:mono/diheme cytochrome c family protein